MEIVPRIVEISGLPSSGKTTLVNNLFRFFEKNGYKCRIIPESATEIKKEGMSGEEKLSLNFFLMTILRTAEEILRVDGEDDLDFILVDRGLLDRLIWNEWMVREVLIDRNSFTILKMFIEYVYSEHSNWKTIILLISFQEAMRRHRQRSGTVLNRSYFANMKNIYKDKKIFKDLYQSSIILLDTSNLSKHKILELALEKLK